MSGYFCLLSHILNRFYCESNVIPWVGWFICRICSVCAPYGQMMHALLSVCIILTDKGMCSRPIDFKPCKCISLTERKHHEELATLLQYCSYNYF